MASNNWKTQNSIKGFYNSEMILLCGDTNCISVYCCE